MRRIILSLIIVFVFTSIYVFSQLMNTSEIQSPRPIYFPNKIYVKTKLPQEIDKKFNVLMSSEITNILNDAGTNSITAPYAKHYTKYGGTFQSSSNGLERICEVVFKDSIDIYELCNTLNNLYEVEYAEPIPIDYIYFTPNDPSRTQQ